MDFFAFLQAVNTDTDLTYTLIRTFIIYLFAIFLFRFGTRRFNLNTPFDFVMVIIIGAVLGRTIYGEASLLNTLGACLLLNFLHAGFAWLAFKYKLIGHLVKGSPEFLIYQGKLCEETMQKHSITEADLQEVCRCELETNILTNVDYAILERSGRISMKRKEI